VHRTSLAAKYRTVLSLIARAEQDLQFSRVVSATYDTLRNNIQLRLDVLKTTASQAAVLGLQTVSAQNRMVVVDWARPARTAKPGIATLVAVSIFLSLLML